MSNSRQDDREPVVRGYAVTHPPGRVDMPSQAGWDQLVYAASGTLEVGTTAGAWTVPPHRAVWVPDHERVTVTCRTPTAVRVLYPATELAALHGPVQAFHVGRFTRELLLHAVRVCPLGDSDPVHAALVTVLLDAVRRLPAAPLWLPLPTDPRAVAFAAVVRDDPAVTTEQGARSVGAGARTLERVFRAETGLSLGAWRRRARILDALAPLAAGATVTTASRLAGYSTPSAFVTAFRAELGTSPRRFLQRP